MEQIKLIASDLDGTLLQNDKTLSPYTRAVLARCRERGILFFVATARPPRALERLIKGLSYDGALCHNGGVALYQGTRIWEQGIDPLMAAKLFQRLKDEFPQIPLSAEIDGDLYANFDVEELWPGAPYHSTDFSAFSEKPVEKLMIRYQSQEQVKRIETFLPKELYCQISDNIILMIQPKGVEKGKALKAVCERLGIPLVQTVAFGDDWNDISMMDLAGTGVAVENALPQVKAAAQELCGSNEEDGPAHWLEQHILTA